jgi:hypothetical protein
VNIEDRPANKILGERYPTTLFHENSWLLPSRQEGPPTYHIRAEPFDSNWAHNEHPSKMDALRVETILHIPSYDVSTEMAMSDVIGPLHAQAPLDTYTQPKIFIRIPYIYIHPYPIGGFQEVLEWL